MTVEHLCASDLEIKANSLFMCGLWAWSEEVAVAEDEENTDVDFGAAVAVVSLTYAFSAYGRNCVDHLDHAEAISNLI